MSFYNFRILIYHIEYTYYYQSFIILFNYYNIIKRNSNISDISRLLFNLKTVNFLIKNFLW